jgi:hypothetical protein
MTGGKVARQWFPPSPRRSRCHVRHRDSEPAFLRDLQSGSITIFENERARHDHFKLLSLLSRNTLLLTMKLSVAALLLLPAVSAAFAPSQPRAFSTSLDAAKSKEEDLEMTRQVIASFYGDAPAEEEKEEKKEKPAKEE